MKITVFSDVAPCSMVDVDQVFGGTYCFCAQDRRVRQAGSKQPATLLFNIEDGGSMFL
jgi:hypothetical protein